MRNVCIKMSWSACVCTRELKGKRKSEKDGAVYWSMRVLFLLIEWINRNKRNPSTFVDEHFLDIFRLWKTSFFKTLFTLKTQQIKYDFPIIKYRNNPANGLPIWTKFLMTMRMTENSKKHSPKTIKIQSKFDTFDMIFFWWEWKLCIYVSSDWWINLVEWWNEWEYE